MIIYATTINQYLSEEKYDYFLQLITPAKRLQLHNYKFINDKKRALYGELLLRYGIITKYNIKNKSIQIKMGRYKKPYCTYPTDLFFNISHSDNWVVCAISDAPIGIDIEKIQLAELRIAQRLFTSHEFNQIMSSELDQDRVFYKFWTLKESYIKFKGKGLHMPLDSFEFTIHKNYVDFKTEPPENVSFYSPQIDPSYCISVCSSKNSNTPKVHLISVEELDNIL